jgi:hypothetical protein
MIKAAECTGMRTSLGMRCRESMLPTGECSRASAMKSVCSSKSSGPIEVVAFDENSAVGNVGVVVVNDAVVMPVIPPMVKHQAKPA